MTGEYVQLHEYPERYPLLRQARRLMTRALRQGGKQWPGRMDVDLGIAAVANLAEGYGFAIHAAVLNDTHLFVYSVTTPWYSNERWLVEQFFIRIAPGDSAGAYQAIENLAHDEETSHIVMATALARNDASLGKLYEAQGYTQQSTQYIKEAAWLQSAQSSPPLPSQ